LLWQFPNILPLVVNHLVENGGSGALKAAAENSDGRNTAMVAMTNRADIGHAIRQVNNEDFLWKMDDFRGVDERDTAGNIS
jgi:hypothetical protein